MHYADYSEELLQKIKKRKRLRELGIKIGKYPTGKYNAITDVNGVRVGHKTIIKGSGKLIPGSGPVRTGVTVIIPNDGIFTKKLMASSFVLNGAGEVSGLIQVNEWGLLETPIALTNTMSVGAVGNSLVKWMTNKFSTNWNPYEVVIPVVGECDDSFLNDAVGQHVSENDVFEAINRARSGAVDEGTVGAGTGMVCCDFKGGIGTSSRIVKIGPQNYTIGTLVLSNFGLMEELRVDGFPVGELLSKKIGNYDRRKTNYGSIITVIATDLPMTPAQLGRLCKRAALGIGRVGSHAAHGSGEIIIGFSTANIVRPGKRISKTTMELMADEFLNPCYQATIEATEEAIINSLTMAVQISGVDDHCAPEIDLSLLKVLFDKYKKVQLD